jgi:hypothetical protein
MTSTPPTVQWASSQREAAFQTWLQTLASTHGLLADTLRPASADASFRRYLRIDSTAGGSLIIMDAPPEQENCRPFVQVARLMREAGLLVPDVLAWDEPQGFMLLSDLGHQTLLDVIDPDNAQAQHAHYMAALDSLLAWQLASKPDVLPLYNEALLRRELQLFPDWYLDRHRQAQLSEQESGVLHKAFDSIVRHNLASPSVFVHRDYMPRNLMIPHAPPLRGSLPPEGAYSPWGGPAANRSPAQQLGVLDFQDAVYGPITYDVASLMRDAFLSWEEDFVIDVTIRYWEKARQAGLMDFEDWHSDFRLLPRGGMDGPAAAPEGGRHLRAADAARRQTQIPGRRAALHRLHPPHHAPLPRAGSVSATDRQSRRLRGRFGLRLRSGLSANAWRAFTAPSR